MKEGYKDTPIGLIPEDWDVVSLSNTGDIISGGTPDTSNPDYWNGQIAWCTPTDITGLNGKRFIDKTARLITCEGLSNSSATLLPENSLVICTRATIGDCAINLIPISTNQGFKSIKAASEWDITFLYYFIKAHKPVLIKQSSGSTFLEISKTAFEKIPIPKPVKSEQSKIASILSTVDDKIDAINERIIQTRQLKNGLMQQLLTKGIGHTRFKDSPLGEIPKSWEIVKLEELSEKIGDGLHATPIYVGKSDFYFINGNNLVNGSIAIDNNTKCVLESEYQKYKKELNDNTILISINGTIGNIGFYKNENVILGKSAAYINCDAGKVHKYFIYYQLQSNKIKYYFDFELTGTTIRNLSLKSIRNTPIPLPSLFEQGEISEILTTVDEKLDVLQEKKTEFEKLKKGLMQKLLTGQIRVNTIN